MGNEVVALRVPCPVCKAAQGAWCRRRRGGRRTRLHPERIISAMDHGLLPMSQFTPEDGM